MAFRLPFLPRGVSSPPQILDNLFLAERVHRLPIAAMLKRAELLVLRELYHRFTLPNAIIACNHVKDRACQYEKTTIDPASVAVRLLVESIDATVVVIDFDGAEA